jgi:hypothetical protein
MSNEAKNQKSDLNALSQATSKTSETSFDGFDGNVPRPFSGANVPYTPTPEMAEALEEFISLMNYLTDREIYMFLKDDLFKPDDIRELDTPEGVRKWVRVWRTVAYQVRKHKLEKQAEVADDCGQ